MEPDADALPLPPWQGPRRRRRDRPVLSLELIVSTALKVVDDEGYDAMTMRRVAERLGTGAASLYAYVEGREELVELVLDRVIGELELPEPDPARWVEQVKDGVRAMRRLYTDHRDLARAGLARIPTRANALGSMERFVAILRAGGLPDQVVAFAADLLPMYATAVAYEESLFAQRFGGAVDQAAMRDFVTQLRDYFASLPLDRFPNLVELAGALTRNEGDERFEFGLDVLVRGLAAQRASAAG